MSTNFCPIFGCCLGFIKIIYYSCKSSQNLGAKNGKFFFCSSKTSLQKRNYRISLDNLRGHYENFSFFCADIIRERTLIEVRDSTVHRLVNCDVATHDKKMKLAIFNSFSRLNTLCTPLVWIRIAAVATLYTTSGYVIKCSVHFLHLLPGTKFCTLHFRHLLHQIQEVQNSWCRVQNDNFAL